jgi:membrane-bound inhibitor of C-type lysozyme
MIFSWVPQNRFIQDHKDPQPRQHRRGSVSLISLQALAQKPNAAAKFTCDSRKTIVATFYSESVQLNLSDGRRLNLPQVMSGSGARYANKDETFVF